MSYEITGKLIQKSETVQRTESFKTREFVIEKSDEIAGRVITNYAKFQCVQDKTALLDRFGLGDEVKVFFNIKGTKWMKDGRENYITNLDAWRIEVFSASQESAAPQQAAAAPKPASAPAYSAPPPPPPPIGADASDDLPF